MARDEQGNGNFNNGNSGKSSRQDSTLSARRARLRSLARQALPPDPYSSRQDEEDAPASTLELEPMQDEKGLPAGEHPGATVDPWGSNTEPESESAPAPSQTPVSANTAEPNTTFAQMGVGAASPPPFPEPALSEPQIPDFSLPEPRIPDVSLPQGLTEPAIADFYQPEVPEKTQPQTAYQEPEPSQKEDVQSYQEPLQKPAFDYSQVYDQLQDEQAQIEQSMTVESSEAPLTYPTDVATNILPEHETQDSQEPEETQHASAEPTAEQADPFAGVDDSEFGYSEDGEATNAQNQENSELPSDSQAAEQQVEQAQVEQAQVEQAQVEQAQVEQAQVEQARSEDYSLAQVAVEPGSEQESEPESKLEDEPEEHSDIEAEDIEPEESKTEKKTPQKKGKPEPKTPEPEVAAEPVVTVQAAPTTIVQTLPPEFFDDSAKRHGEAIELLNSIDQSLGVCAMNLSALQKTAGEQTEAFKSFKETLQNQTFFEIGLNLNTLMESMSAALEPMKAVGELVPSIDQLVTAIEAKEAEDKESRLTPEKLVTALADQLSSGQIDPWTFRCAYMAVYPDEHPADLLHRLVELLGTQRLPGDLFRAAYDAIQTPEPPPEYSTSSGADEKVRTIKVQDESLLSEIEELRKSNEEFKSLVSARDGELSSIIEEREQEYKEVLNQKEIELKETQETLQARFEEFNARYDEMVETVNQREEDLQGKSSELNKKDSEIIQLKAQLDELQEQFRDTVGDLQKQLTSTKQAADEAAQKAAQEKSAARPAKPANSGGFFDTSTDMKTPLVDSGPARPLLQQQMETFKTMSKSSGPGVAPAGQAPVSMDNGSPAGAAGAQQVPMTPAVQSGFGGAPQTGPLSEPSTQAVPRGQGQGPTMSGSLGQSGSYGNGVRAQVFEVIVRQALAGAPWREICAGPMQVNNISPDEVEAEVNRRQALLKK